MRTEKTIQSDNPLPDSIPNDIRVPWMNVLRCLQSHARQQCGAAILTISIVVKDDGLPKFWTTPRVTRFEPKAEADIIIDFLQKLL